jgi:hypothetical protein
MIDRPEGPLAQQLGQFIRIGLVPLMALPRLPSAIADHNPVHPFHQEIV